MFYHTKVVFLKYLDAMSSCSHFDITLVSLLDIGADSKSGNHYMNPWTTWLPKGKRIGKHVTLNHFIISNNSTLSLLGPKSKELFRTKGGSIMFHDVHVLQWWLSLPAEERETYHSLWIVEDDTFYNGDLCAFLQKYSAKKWDYLSTPTSSAVNWPHKDLRTHQLPDDVYFRAMDHFVGISGRLLDMMRFALNLDIFVHSEAFAVTLCKANTPLCRLEGVKEAIGKQYAWNNRIDYKYYRTLIQNTDGMWYHGFRVNLTIQDMSEIFEDNEQFYAADVMKMEKSLSDLLPKEKEFLQSISKGHQLEFRWKSILCISCAHT